MHFVTTMKSQDAMCGTYHPSHGCRGVVSIEIGGPPHGLFLDNVCALVRCTGGHHVVGRVRGMAASARGR